MFGHRHDGGVRIILGGEGVFTRSASAWVKYWLLGVCLARLVGRIFILMIETTAPLEEASIAHDGVRYKPISAGS